MARELKVIWSYDSYDCEDCGGSDSTGAHATLDGICILDRPAYAHCFGSEYVQLHDVAEAALSHLGVSIAESTEAGTVVPEQGLFIAWQHLDGRDEEGKRLFSTGARAWLNGSLVFDLPADLATCVHTNAEEIYLCALNKLDIVIEEEHAFPDDDDQDCWGDDDDFDEYLDYDEADCFDEGDTSDEEP